MASDRRDPIQESLKKNVSGDPGGILAALWRSILIKDKFLPVISYLIDMYAKNNKGKKIKNPSTVLKLVTAPSMTWKSFIFLISKILPVKKVTITIELEYLNNKKGVHTIDIPVTQENVDKDIAESIDMLADNIYTIVNRNNKSNKKEEDDKRGSNENK